MESQKQEIGTVTHYYSKIGVAVIQLKGTLTLGDKITIKGSTSNFEQAVDSMQIERKDVKKAEAGQSVGIKVKDKTRPGDVVYK